MEWVAHLLGSDVFRGGALLAAVVTGITAITLQLLKRGPVLAKLDDEARKALDDSTQAELKRLGERLANAEQRVDGAEHRHAQCEEALDHQRQQVRQLQDDMTGLRRQLAQYEMTTVTMLRNRETAPAPKPAKRKP